MGWIKKKTDKVNTSSEEEGGKSAAADSTEPADTHKDSEPDQNEFIYKVMQFSSENTDPEAAKAMKKEKRRRSALTAVLVVLAVVFVLGATLLAIFHDLYSKLNYTQDPTDAELEAAIERWQDAEAAGELEEDDYSLFEEGEITEDTTVEELDPRVNLSRLDVSEYPDYESLLAYAAQLAIEAADLYAEAEAIQQQADLYAGYAQARLEYDEEQARLEEERIKNEIIAALEADGSEPITDENVMNILLIGTDTRDIDNLYSRSDAMILLSVNKETKEIILTSFMRDSYVYIPRANTYNRLNAANAIGGPTLLCRTISENFGVRVDKYATVNFFSFIDIVDALGGLDIKVTEEEIGHLNDNLVHQNYVRGYDDEMDFIEHGTAGLMHLNGNQALAYARIRYVGGDSGRTARQRLVISLIIEKVMDMSITELYDLMDMIMPLVRTNVTELECFSVILNSAEYLDYTIKSIRIPYDGAYKSKMIKGMSVLELDLSKCRNYLRRQIYG